MAKKDKKEMVEEAEEEVQEEPVPEPAPEPQGRKEVKRIEGVGFTNILYDNGEKEKVYH